MPGTAWHDRYHVVKTLVDKERTKLLVLRAQDKLGYTNFYIGKRVLDAEEAECLKHGIHQLRAAREIAVMEATRGHPSFISLVEVVDRVDGRWIVMEHASHGDLHDYMEVMTPIGSSSVNRLRVNSDQSDESPNSARTSPSPSVRTRLDPVLTEDIARGIFYEMCSRVAELHRLGWAHGDVKPENFVIDDFGRILLIDFGFARPALGGFVDVISEGTLAYAAPEILRREHARPAPVDVWALGVCLYILAYGALPFGGCASGDSWINEVRVAIVNVDLYFAPTRHVPRSLVSLIRRMLNPDPDLRPTVEEVLVDPWMKGPRTAPLFAETWHGAGNFGCASMSPRASEQLPLVESLAGTRARSAESLSSDRVATRTVSLRVLFRRRMK